MNAHNQQPGSTEKQIKDWRTAKPSDVVFQQTLADGTIYNMTKEEFDRVVDVFSILAKWDKELKAKTNK
jgi:hypothetical protein